MINRDAHNKWAESYDQMRNKTRDLEAVALRSMLERFSFNSCLEIGRCIRKNTSGLASLSSKVTAVDLSEEMISREQGPINLREPGDSVQRAPKKNFRYEIPGDFGNRSILQSV